MCKPSYGTLSSFVFSLLLTSAVLPSRGSAVLAAAGAPAAQMAATAVLNGLRAQGMPADADIALSPSAATPLAAAPVSAHSTPVLTPALMEKMLKLIADKGIDHNLIAPLANALGFGASGQGWPSRSVAAGDPASVLHGFYICSGDEQDIAVTMGIAGKSLYGYRAHRDGTLTAAFIGDIPTHKITPRDLSEAQKDFDNEIAIWASIVAKPVTASN